MRLAGIACRPDLLSTTTPAMASPTMIDSTACVWYSTSQPASITMRSRTSLCFSGSLLRCQCPFIASIAERHSSPMPHRKSSGMLTSPTVASPPRALSRSMTSGLAAAPCRRDTCRRASGAASNDHHIVLAVHRQVAGRLAELVAVHRHLKHRGILLVGSPRRARWPRSGIRWRIGRSRRRTRGQCGRRPHRCGWRRRDRPSGRSCTRRIRRELDRLCGSWRLRGLGQRVVSLACNSERRNKDLCREVAQRCYTTCNMAKYILRPPEPRCSPIEDVLHDAEELLGVQLTLHDLASVFVDTEGRRLLGRWRGSHRRYETCARSHCRRCLDHCYGEVNRTAARSDGPFVHRCWRGLVEVVLPICQEGVHVATLFAGQWRSHGVGKRCPAYVRAVPVAKADDLRRMGRLMQAVADGLPAELRRVQGDVGRPATRGEEIRRFIRLHAAQPVRLSELARSLHLSPSRTSHPRPRGDGAELPDAAAGRAAAQGAGPCCGRRTCRSARSVGCRASITRTTSVVSSANARAGPPASTEPTARALRPEAAPSPSR